MIISIDAEKSLWQNSTPIYDQNSPESRHRKNIPQSITSKIRNKTRVPTLPLLFNIIFEVLVSYSNQRRKRDKRNPCWRSKTLTVSRWCDSLHRKPKDATRKLLELITEYSQVTGYKINTQKCLEFLYTNNENSGREIKETIPFTIETRRTHIQE